MDLTMWDQKYYRTNSWQDLILHLGCHRWRCEPCRCNFISIRPRRESYRQPAARVRDTPVEDPQPDRV